MNRTLLAIGVLVLAVLGAGLLLLYTPAGTSTSAEDAERGVFSSLFPFGNSTTDRTSRTENTAPDADTVTVPRLRKISEAQVSGASFATGVTGGLVVRYVERETGHIYETPVDALTTLRLTNTTVPRAIEAVWLTASSSVLRFIGENDAIENFYGFFTGTSTDQSLRGSFLKNYVRIAPTPQGVLGVREEPTGSTLEIVSPDTQAVRTVLTSPIRSWIPLTARNRVFVYSAPSGLAEGSLYEVKDGRLTSLVRNVPGLTAVVREDGERILVSSGAVQSAVLFVTDGDGVPTDGPTRRTLAGKCAWMGNTADALCAVPKELPRGVYPDDWLLGRIQTDDALWRINTIEGTQEALFDFADEGVAPFDVISLRVSPAGDYTLFINKTDQTLWSLRLAE